jgi:DNA-binding response OmpR family regulator
MKTNACQILMVDDEPNVLSAYRRTVGRNFELTLAEGGAAALALLNRPDPFAVIVTDMRMPGMNGVEFITAARHKSRDSVFMMLTGNADQQTAIDAINRGQIFRFLNKPCTTEQLDTAVKAAIRQHELVTSERVLLRDTVSGSIKLLMDALEMASPTAFGYQSAIKHNQQEVSAALGQAVDWQVGIAASLCLIGLVAIPQPIVQGEIAPEVLISAADIGGRLLGHIPRLQAIARMIRRQRETGVLPDDLTAADPQLIEDTGARVLRFSVDLALEERALGSRASALAKLGESRRYDARLVAAVKCLLPEPEIATPGGPAVVSAAAVSTDDVVPGMVLTADVLLKDGRLLLSRGQAITELASASLKNFTRLGLVGSTVQVQKAA